MDITITFQGKLIEKRVTDLTLEEFLSYGPQNASTNVMDSSLFVL